nr:HAMP domain-containing sensor histidine kinase [Nocardioides sp. MAH-18]
MLEDQAHFLSITAHELRTPVSVLGGTAQMLADHWADLEEDERGELLEGMTSSAGRLRRLLDDLLTASRLQSSRLELHRSPVDVGPIVAACVATAQRSHPGAPITADVSTGLEVDGDAVRLGQLVDNLIGNALVHGSPPVAVTAEGDADRVRIRVRDSGAGVPDTMQDRLFERFSTGRAAGGTGLGLFIVRQLAQAHGGDAWYRLPEAGDAGEFVVEMPRLGHAPDTGAR